MSPAHSYDPTPVLTAQRGGLAPTARPTVKMHPSEIALTLSADVLRLKCSMNARAVLAEIVSLHAANAGCCDASDAHFAARLTLSTNTVSRAVQELETEGLVLKVTTRVPTGYYRTLTPKPASIKAKAAANPYPQIGGRPTPKMRVPHPQNEGTPTPNLGFALPPNWGDNTPLDTPVSIQVNTAASAASVGQEESEASTSSLPTQSSASHTEGGATDVATSKHKPIGPRGWVYDPHAIAENLRLPFASPEFRTAWVGYRTYREEQKHRRLTGGMMEQQQLDKLGQLAAGDEANALALISQTIAKGWQDFYPLDKPRTHAAAIPTSKPGTARHHVPVVKSYGKL